MPFIQNSQLFIGEQLPTSPLSFILSPFPKPLFYLSPFPFLSLSLPFLCAQPIFADYLSFHFITFPWFRQMTSTCSLWPCRPLLQTSHRCPCHYSFWMQCPLSHYSPGCQPPKAEEAKQKSEILKNAWILCTDMVIEIRGQFLQPSSTELWNLISKVQNTTNPELFFRSFLCSTRGTEGWKLKEILLLLCCSRKHSLQSSEQPLLLYSMLLIVPRTGQIAHTLFSLTCSWILAPSTNTFHYLP